MTSNILLDIKLPLQIVSCKPWLLECITIFAYLSTFCYTVCMQLADIGWIVSPLVPLIDFLRWDMN